MTDKPAAKRRLGWVLGLTSTGYFMVILDSVVGLSMLTAGFVWVAWHASLATSSSELVIALLIAGVGISMALPTVPTAVLSAVAPHEMGKASGINYMAQRFGVVFAIAIGSAVFSANGHLGSPTSVTAGFRPALWACAGLAVLATLTAFCIGPRRTVRSRRPWLQRLPGRRDQPPGPKHQSLATPGRVASAGPLETTGARPPHTVQHHTRGGR